MRRLRRNVALVCTALCCCALIAIVASYVHPEPPDPPLPIEVEEMRVFPESRQAALERPARVSATGTDPSASGVRRSILVRGTVVSEGGEGLAADVYAVAAADSRNPVSFIGVQTGQGPLSVAASADGSFALISDYLAGAGYLLAVAPGYAPALKSFVNGADVALVLERGTLLCGRVVDESGLPVQLVDLRLRVWNAFLADIGYVFSAVSHPDGSFSMNNRVSGARCSISAYGGGYVQTPTRTRPVSELLDKTGAVLVTVRRAVYLAGRVESDVGEVQPEAEVILSSNGLQRVIPADEGGRFFVEREASDGDSVEIGARLGAAGDVEMRRVSWGQEDIVVVPGAFASCTVMVQGPDGQAVERFAVVLISDREFSGRPTHSGFHPGGMVRLDGLKRGLAWLQILPLDPEYYPGRFERLGVGLSSEVVYRLARSWDVTFQVRDTSGNTIDGVTVELVGGLQAARLLPNTPLLDTRVQRSTSEAAVLVGKGVSNRDGIATCLVAEGPASYTARLSGQGIVPEVVPGLQIWSQPSYHIVRVRRGGSLSGEVRNPTRLKANLVLENRRDRGRWPSDLSAAGGRIELSGRQAYRVDHVAGGLWDLYVYLGEARLRNALGSIEVTEGSESRLDVDLSAINETHVEMELVKHEGVWRYPAYLSLWDTGGKWDSSEPVMQCAMVPGAIPLDLPSGKYRCEVQELQESGAYSVYVATEDVVVYAPGGCRVEVRPVATRVNVNGRLGDKSNIVGVGVQSGTRRPLVREAGTVWRFVFAITEPFRLEVDGQPRTPRIDLLWEPSIYTATVR